MNTPAQPSAALTLLTLTFLLLAGCATSGGATSEMEPPMVDSALGAPAEIAAPIEEASPARSSQQEEGKVPLAVAESEHADQPPTEVVVQGSHSRDEAIHDLVAEAQVR